MALLSLRNESFGAMEPLEQSIAQIFPAFFLIFLGALLILGIVYLLYELKRISDEKVRYYQNLNKQLEQKIK